jgi:cell division protein FtsW (lipid II flippase)
MILFAKLLVEEWGLVGGTVILMLYLWFLYRCIAIARGFESIF